MLTSQKALYQADYKLDKIMSFLRGNYASAVLEQPHAADLDVLAPLCREVVEQLTAAAIALDAEITSSRKEKGLL